MSQLKSATIHPDNWRFSMTEIGYIRVSSITQNTDRQLDGIELDKIFEDKVSGKDTNRPQLNACLDYLREGDTLHVHSWDRLARNLLDLEGIVNNLTSKGVSVKSVKEGLTFEGGKEMNLRDKLLFQILGAFSEFERANIRSRQREGIEIAKKKGVYKGKVAKINRAPILADLQTGMKKVEILKRHKISRSYLYKIIAEAG